MNTTATATEKPVELVLTAEDCETLKNGLIARRDLLNAELAAGRFVGMRWLYQTEHNKVENMLTRLERLHRVADGRSPRAGRKR